MTWIPFNRPYATGSEFTYIAEAIENGHLSGNGPFAGRCTEWLEERTDCIRALLTHSCTGALEMAVILAEVGPGDEVVMPSFTFVSTANAVALRGGVPVFVDIRPDTLTLDSDRVEAALTERTKAILPVHYAGVAADLDRLLDLAADRDLFVIEDAAQALGSSYRGRPLGGIGNFAALSFHETKNVHCGEGGALLVNGERWIERAEVVQEKGTNRSRFFRGQVDKYTWVDIGSSYLLSEIGAAFLWAQFEHADAIMELRLRIWNRYHEAFTELEARELVRRPVIPESCTHNAHMYYLLVRDLETRSRVIGHLKESGVHAVFHYIPLHSSEAGVRLGRSDGTLAVTDDASDRLLRLPIWVGMNEADIDRVINATIDAVESTASS